MRKALKIIGIILGIIVLIIATIAIYFNAKGFPAYEVNVPELKVEPDSAMIARGEYIVNLSCQHCHKSKEGGNILSGRFFEENDLGKWYAPNISQHPEAGIGNWSDGEIAYTLRTGVHKDGELLAPMMPRFNHLSDEDLHSVIAYLRSEAQLVQPSAAVQPDSEPSLLGKVISNLAIKPIPYPEERIAAPARTDRVAYGKYLSTGLIHCYHCHSASFETANDLEPEKSEGFMGGGNAIINIHNPDEVIASSNITMHPEYGIGSWSEQEFIRAVKTGIDNEGNTLSTAMPRLTNFTDEDVSAIWSYLQSIPKISNQVKQSGLTN